MCAAGDENIARAAVCRLGDHAAPELRPLGGLWFQMWLSDGTFDQVLGVIRQRHGTRLRGAGPNRTAKTIPRRFHANPVRKPPYRLTLGRLGIGQAESFAILDDVAGNDPPKVGAHNQEVSASARLEEGASGPRRRLAVPVPL